MNITSQLTTLRGTILESSIPSGAKTDTSKGIPPRDVVEYISQGELVTSCLKLAKSDKKVLTHVHVLYMYTYMYIHVHTCMYIVEPLKLQTPWDHIEISTIIMEVSFINPRHMRCRVRYGSRFVCVYVCVCVSVCYHAIATTYLVCMSRVRHHSVPCRLLKIYIVWTLLKMFCLGDIA